jgi:hypothetical protein
MNKNQVGVACIDSRAITRTPPNRPTAVRKPPPHPTTHPVRAFTE